MESLILERNRSDRPNELVFGLFTSIILHSVLLIGGSYWLKVKAPEQKQDLSDAIPIEYIDVPANETKKPPETSRRAARDSVAGGEAKPEKAMNIAKSAPTTSDQSNQGLPTTEAAEVLQPQPTQPKAVSPNLSAQQPQSKPAKIAVAPKITPPKSQPESTARTRATPPEPQPQPTTLTSPFIPPEPQTQPTTLTPTTTPVESKLRQFATARTTPSVPKPEPTALTPPFTPPKPQPTTDIPTTTLLESKLRQFATARTTPPTPQPQPTAVTPSIKPPVPTEPTTDTPTTTALESKLRQFATARTTLPEPQPQPTALTPPFTPPVPTEPITDTPTTTPSVPIPQTTVTRTGTPPTPKRPKITIATTTPPVSKPRQTAFTPTTKSPGRLTRPQKKNQLAANTSSVPGTRATTRTSTRSQPSLKSGGSSSLGGPVALSSRNFADYAPSSNSNRLNPGTEGIDARQDADLGPYLQQLQEKVRQQWIPGVTQSSRRTVLHFTIARSGQVTRLNVAQSSGFDFTDEAALGAVKRATPFAPLPANYTDNYLKIQFTFNINIDGELELWGG